MKSWIREFFEVLGFIAILFGIFVVVGVLTRLVIVTTYQATGNGYLGVGVGAVFAVVVTVALLVTAMRNLFSEPEPERTQNHRDTERQVTISRERYEELLNLETNYERRSNR